MKKLQDIPETTGDGVSAIVQGLNSPPVGTHIEKKFFDTAIALPQLILDQVNIVADGSDETFSSNQLLPALRQLTREFSKVMQRVDTGAWEAVQSGVEYFNNDQFGSAFGAVYFKAFSFAYTSAPATFTIATNASGDPQETTFKEIIDSGVSFYFEEVSGNKNVISLTSRDRDDGESPEYQISATTSTTGDLELKVFGDVPTSTGTTFTGWVAYTKN